LSNDFFYRAIRPLCQGVTALSPRKSALGEIAGDYSAEATFASMRSIICKVFGIWGRASVTASIAACVSARAAKAAESVICAATAPIANGNSVAAVKGVERLALVADELIKGRIEAYLTRKSCAR
jgi:hypothetical protein